MAAAGSAPKGRGLPEAPHESRAAPAVEYQVAIPTSGRWRPASEVSRKRRLEDCEAPFILSHTLELLAEQRIPMHRVTLFVASEEEAQRYRAALRESAWRDVRIVISGPGNRDSRNFIYRYFPSGTYVVSMDDDLERVVWKVPDQSVRTLPAGGLERLIFDGHRQMTQHRAFLWGLNTSQNVRLMRSRGISLRNGLVNGYFNGFICRPECPELLRTLTDTMEDAEFSLRHFAKDGAVVRYRMYAAITSTASNLGGLERKFEKVQLPFAMAPTEAERNASLRRHRFLNPSGRRTGDAVPCAALTAGGGDRRGTRRVGLGAQLGVVHKKRIRGPAVPPTAPRMHNDDGVLYGANTKKEGTKAHKLFSDYQCAKTAGEARERGARGVDFAFDWCNGLMEITRLEIQPTTWDCEVRGDLVTGRRSLLALGQTATEDLVYVRVLECGSTRLGVPVPRAALAALAAQCPRLRAIQEQAWSSVDGPLADVPVELLRNLLYWASTGRLLFDRRMAEPLTDLLAALGVGKLSSAVRRCVEEQAPGDGRRLPSAPGVRWRAFSVRRPCSVPTTAMTPWKAPANPPVCRWQPGALVSGALRAGPEVVQVIEEAT